MWDEVITDRTKYPDDLKLTLPDGKDTTVGKLREALMPKAEFTRYSQKEAQDKRHLEGQLRESQQALQQASLAVEEAKRQSVAHTGTADSFEDYLRDPTWRPVAEKAAKVDALEKKLTEMESRLQGHEQTWFKNIYETQKAQIKKADPDADVDAVVQFALQRGIPDLHDAYFLSNKDRLLTRVVAEAEKKGYEKAKAEPPPAPVLSGARRAATSLPPEMPKTLDEAAELVLSGKDAEMNALMTGGGA